MNDLDSSLPLREGELAIVVDPKGRRHLIQLQPGNRFHHPKFGPLLHSEIIGQPAGVCFVRNGAPVICLRLVLEDFVMRRLKRSTQIIYPKDQGALLIKGEIFPGARVLEAGLGSGATSLLLLRHLGSRGQLTSYEIKEEVAAQTLQTIEEYKERYGGLEAQHELVLADVYKGIEERHQDTIILDVPEPSLAVRHVQLALKPGGILLCWVPTALQVYRLVRRLQEDPSWVQIQAAEILERGWSVGRNTIRPQHRMVAHTGFLIRARLVAVRELDGLAED